MSEIKDSENKRTVKNILIYFTGFISGLLAVIFFYPWLNSQKVKNNFASSIQGKAEIEVERNQDSFVDTVPIAKEKKYFTISRLEADEQLKNYISLLKSIDVVPVFDEKLNKLIGYKILRIDKDTFISSKSGLQKDDIILGINQMKISSINEVLQVFIYVKSNILELETMAVDILRDKKPMHFEYKFI